MSLETGPVLSVYQYGLSVMGIRLVLVVSMACPCHGENPSDPKSGGEFDPDKLGCATSCQGDKTFSCAFFLDLLDLLIVILRL